MADGTVLNAGAGGDTIATDDIAGTKYPISKLAHGALDSATIVSTASGLPVQGQVAQDAAMAGNILPLGGRASAAAPTDMSADGDAVYLWTTLKGALNIADAGGNISIDDGGNVISVDWNGTAPPIGAGTEAAALRVTVATDSTGVLSVDDNGGSLTVDVGTALPAGTNNIGDVDVLSFPTTVHSADYDTGAGTDTTLTFGIAIPASGGATVVDGGGGTEATALRVTIANDSTGVLSVDDNGGSLTIDNAQLSVVGGGTEAAAIRVTIANDSTGVLSVDDNGGSLTVDVGTALPAGTNNIGDVDVLSVVPGTGATNLGKAEDAAHTSADTGVYVLAVRDDALAAHSGTDGDYESLHTNALGALYVQQAPNTTGGMTIFRSLDLDETEEEIKATAGQLYSISAFNHTAGPLYLKFYNATAANVTVGTTTPVLTFTVPGNADSDGAGFIWNSSIGFAFGTAITAAVTTAIADNDTGAPAANACSVDIGYA